MILYEKPFKIELLPDYELSVNGKKLQPHIRTIGDMTDVLLRNAKMSYNEPMYFMYRNIYQVGALRYDITILRGIKVQGESNKTYGHYHPNAPDGIPYPEVYQVLKGRATFILQKKIEDKFEVIIINAKEKEVVLFPPGYGHVSVADEMGELVLANIVSNSFESDYNEYKKRNGAAYYYSGDIVFCATVSEIPNKNYNIRSTERLSAEEMNIKYNFQSKDLLTELYKNPKKFEFLDKPSLKFAASDTTIYKGF